VAYTKKIKAGLVKVDYTQFVGEDGTLFYNSENGTLRISDGATPGGQPVNLIGDFNDIAIGNIVVDDTTIRPAADNTDLNLEATGTGTTHLTTPIKVTKVDLQGADILTIKDDGQVKIIVETADSTEGAVGIVGNPLGQYQSPVQTGVMLHITGQQDDVDRNYIDGVNNYTLIAGRRYNGTPTAPTAVLANEPIARWGSNAYNGTGWGTGGVARIQMVASENHTTGASGTRLELWATPNGSTTISREAYVDGGGLFATNLTTTGRANITNMNVTGSTPVLTVSANAQGLTKVAVLPGTIAQFTPKDAVRSYVIQDSYGIDPTFSATAGQYVFRTGRGTNASPTAVQANDILGEVGGAGWGATGYGGVLAASVKFVAAENFTDSARGGKLVVRLIPVGSNTPTDCLTITPSALTLAAGASITGRLKATAGTTDDPSIQLSAGPLPTVPVPGAISYNGIAFYAVPQDSELGVIPTEQIFVSNEVRNLTAGVTTAQSIFGKTVHLSANTRYHYILKAQIFKNGSASNTPTLNYGLALNGGATLFAHGYQVLSSVGTTAGAVAEVKTASIMTNYITTGFDVGVPVTTAMGVSSAYANIEIRGWIAVNTAGTVDFQLAFSAAPNSACSIQPTASVRIHPVSAAGADTSIGTWA
jgi:hypothetical protein